MISPKLLEHLRKKDLNYGDVKDKAYDEKSLIFGSHNHKKLHPQAFRIIENADQEIDKEEGLSDEEIQKILSKISYKPQETDIQIPAGTKWPSKTNLPTFIPETNIIRKVPLESIQCDIQALVEMVTSLGGTPVYSIANWVDEKNVDCRGLFYNALATDYLEEFPELVTEWSEFSKDPSNIKVLEKNIDKIDKWSICENPSAAPIIEKILPFADWGRVSANPAMIPIMKKYPDKVRYDTIWKNPYARYFFTNEELKKVKIDWFVHSRHCADVEFMRENLDKLVPSELSRNKYAIPILIDHPYLIDWGHLCSNVSAIPILKLNKHMIDYKWLRKNPAAFELFEDHLDLADWTLYSSDPLAIDFLLRHLDRVDWKQFSLNTAAVPVLIKNIDKVYMPHFACNPAAVEYIKQFPLIADCNKFYFSTNPKIFEISVPKTIKKIKGLLKARQ